MKQAYSPLFALRCRHDYFADGVARVLELRPSVGTAALLARERMLVRAEPDGLSVYACGRPEPGQAPGPGRLSFLVSSRDPYLANYTLAPSPPAAAGTACVLENGAGGVELAARRLPLMRRRLRYPLPAPGGRRGDGV